MVFGIFRVQKWNSVGKKSLENYDCENNLENVLVLSLNLKRGFEQFIFMFGVGF